jgi:hypothetical protein
LVFAKNWAPQSVQRNPPFYISGHGGKRKLEALFWAIAANSRSLVQIAVVLTFSVENTENIPAKTRHDSRKGLGGYGIILASAFSVT